MLQVYHLENEYRLRKTISCIFEPLSNFKKISRICLQLHETIKMLHKGLKLYTIPVRNEPKQCKWYFWGTLRLFITSKLYVLLKEYSCKYLAQDQSKSYDLHSKCWSYPGIHELDLSKLSQENVIGEGSISSVSSETLSSLSSSWPGFFFFNSAEDQVGFTDKSIIAYLVGKSTVL